MGVSLNLAATIQTAGGERLVYVEGRNAWALRELHRAGERGVTPMDNPAPRWSAYVYNLRQMGIDVETIHEGHSGPFPGTHARYVLRETVTIRDAHCAVGGAT